MRESHEIAPSRDQRRDDGRRDRLGERRELEHGIGIDLGGLARLADAEAAEIDHLVLEHDADGEPRHHALVDDLLRHRLDARDRRLHLLDRCLLRQGRTGRRQQPDDDPNRFPIVLESHGAPRSKGVVSAI